MRNLNTIRNVVLLSFCQALGNTGNIIVFSVSALAAMEIVSNKSLATVPLFIQFLAATITTVPASFLMERYGRKTGFILGSFMACIGGGLAFIAIGSSNFLLFCLGSAFIGILIGFIPYYRFAAIDSASEPFKNTALSLVLAGGVLAAIIGPTLADFSKDLFQTEYSGNFLLILLLPLVSISLLTFIKIVPREDARQENARPILEIIRKPKFLLALFGGIISYGVMALLMVATPISMKHSALPFVNITFVIQWHVLGMFAPSFFTGGLIQKFGVYKVLISGGICNLCCVAINMTGTSLYHYWTALFLLGIGWNFLFIGASSLLTECYSESEKALVQAINEFLILLTVSISSLTSGILMEFFGWKALNLFVLPQIVAILCATLWLYLRTPDTPRLQTDSNPAP
jgi:MFS family permease